MWTSCVCVSKLCVDKLCVDKLCVSKLCVDKLFVDKLCVSKLLCVHKLCVSKRRREEADGRRDTEPKTRTPHKDVGNKINFSLSQNQHRPGSYLSTAMLTLLTV